MKERQIRMVERVGALLDKTLAEAEEERKNWSLREELNQVAAAWELPAKDLKWRTPVGTTNFARSKVLEMERVKNPFSKERVRRILEAVEIGDIVMGDQCQQVEELLKSYADVFALDVAEVLLVDWASHKLNVDPDMKLPWSAHQPMLTEMQKEWYYNMLDTMEEGGVIARVEVDFMQCVSHTKLVPKDARKMGMMRTEVIKKCNKALRAAGRPAAFEEMEDSPLVKTMGPTFTTIDDTVPSKLKTKWRIVHAYKTINEAMKIPTFPTGDLKSKQRHIAGHTMGSIINLASGYYAVAMDNHTVPFMVFHVPGRGYYVYLQMPFGLTGVPYTFCEAMVMVLGEMLGRELENWIDGIAFTSDTFEEHFEILSQFLSRCRAAKLSIMSMKMKLFQREFVFTGA